MASVQDCRGALLGGGPLTVLVVGPAGAGKSSTVNAVFGRHFLAAKPAEVRIPVRCIVGSKFYLDQMKRAFQDVNGNEAAACCDRWDFCQANSGLDGPAGKIKLVLWLCCALSSGMQVYKSKVYHCSRRTNI